MTTPTIPEHVMEGDAGRDGEAELLLSQICQAAPLMYHQRVGIIRTFLANRNASRADRAEAALQTIRESCAFYRAQPTPMALAVLSSIETALAALESKQ